MPQTSQARPKRLLECLTDEVRLRHYSPRTERAYVGWVRRFVRFNANRHPAELGLKEVQGFLTHLAVAEQVSASTQNQALAALLFLYDAVLRQPLEAIDTMPRPKRSLHIPVVLTPGEVQRLLERMTGPAALMAALLYGSGLRLLECVQLRVKDIDLERTEIRVRCGKGAKDRVVPQFVGRRMMVVARGGEYPLPAPFSRGIGILRRQCLGQFDIACATGQVLVVLSANSQQVIPQWLRENPWQNGEPVLATLAASDDDLTSAEVYVFDP
jgi:hypothetical protein